MRRQNRSWYRHDGRQAEIRPQAIAANPRNANVINENIELSRLSADLCPPHSPQLGAKLDATNHNLCSAVLWLP